MTANPIMNSGHATTFTKQIQLCWNFTVPLPTLGYISSVIPLEQVLVHLFFFQY
jgi:hypothetical protein